MQYARSVVGLVMFGVPNHGIKTSHWKPIVDNRPNESLVRNLAPGSIYLRMIRDRFEQDYNSLSSTVISVYETKLSGTAKVCRRPTLSLDSNLSD